MVKPEGHSQQLGHVLCMGTAVGLVANTNTILAT